MARLYRPHIPLDVRCRVLFRQLNYDEKKAQAAINTHTSWRRLLNNLLDQFAHHEGCEVSDFNLDHDPPLAARPKHRRGLSEKTFYTPDANDPEHLFYRPHGPQFDGSHLIKTNVRGDHGQHPDRVLIKKERRRERGPKPKRGPKIKSPGFRSSINKSTAKPKWPSRPFNRRSK
jgi:hypothetical protein